MTIQMLAQRVRCQRCLRWASVNGAARLSIRVWELSGKIITIVAIRVWGCLALRCCGSLVGMERQAQSNGNSNWPSGDAG